MLSNVFVFNAPWHQNGWDGTICPAPADNQAYCQKAASSYLIGTCAIMAGREHLDRTATTENQIQRGLKMLVEAWPVDWKEKRYSRDVWKQTPVVDLATAPDRDFGRLHGQRGRWEPPEKLLTCRHLRPDPQCSPALSLFKEKPTRHGLANQYTDDTFTFSGIDYSDVLATLEKRPVGSGKPLFALICCKNNPMPTVDENAIVVVGALKISQFQQDGSCWQFKGESGARLPLQELLRHYGTGSFPVALQEIFNQLPTLKECKGIFAIPHPTEAEQLFCQLALSAEAIAAFIDNQKNHDLSFSPEPLKALYTSFKDSPKFKYPNLGQVLKHITGNSKGEMEHVASYYVDQEDALKQELDERINTNTKFSDLQKTFFQDYLVYYDIDASYMDSLSKLFASGYRYSSYWGVIERKAGFPSELVANPYQLARGVELTSKDLSSLKLDFKRIDNGEEMRRACNPDAWQADCGRAYAQAYDQVLKREKGDDWARVASKGNEKSAWEKAASLLVKDKQTGMFQRDVVAKAKEIIDAFYADERVKTPDEFYTCRDDEIKSLKENLTVGFQNFYAKFPEKQQGISWDDFLKSNKGQQVGQAIDEQLGGLQQILQNRFTIITGKAGAGKSEMFNTVVEQLKHEEAFLFLAPTGKAVQAIQEKIGDKVHKDNFLTIAKFLVKAQAMTEVFEPASSDQLEDFSVTDKKGNTIQLIVHDDKPVNIIIDEASMIDIISMANLCHTLSALWGKPDKIRRFVLVGDINQLPPVESGYPFRQLLDNFEKIFMNGDPKPFGFCRLDVSLRFIVGETEDLVLTHYADSFVPNNNEAETELMPPSCGTITKQKGTENFYVGGFSDRASLQDCLQWIFFDLQLNFVKEGEFWKIGWGPVAASAQKKPTLAEAIADNVKNLEKTLVTMDERLKASSDKEEKTKIREEVAKQANAYFLGMVQCITPTKKNYFGVMELGAMIQGFYPAATLEKYIQTRNNRKDDVFNGNLAVKYKKGENGHLFYPDSAKELPAQEKINKNEVEPAYAITVHKSQGSGFSVTIAVLPVSIHEGLRTKAMQYTAVTRTKDICILLKEEVSLSENGQ